MPNSLLETPAALPRYEDPGAVSQAASFIPPEANDNELLHAPRQPEARTFELPAGIWGAMVACYTIFLIALLGATGGAHASLAIAVSAIYVAMFFGTARVMMRQAPRQAPSPLDGPNGSLQTAYGPLARREAYGQILIVPASVALFAIAISVISAIVM